MANRPRALPSGSESRARDGVMPSVRDMRVQTGGLSAIGGNSRLCNPVAPDDSAVMTLLKDFPLPQPWLFVFPNYVRCRKNQGKEVISNGALPLIDLSSASVCTSYGRK